MIEEKFNDKLDTVLSELEKMNKLVKQPSQKRPSHQPTFIEALVESVAVKSISFRSSLIHHSRKWLNALIVTSICQCIIH
jgi:hypothetical protein